MLPSVQGSPQSHQWECFLVFANFSLFKTPFLGQSSFPTSFVSFFVFYIFSYLFSKTMSCFSGCLLSSAGNQKLFCGIYSALKCSFDEFVGEKVVSPSYSSATLGPPPLFAAFETYLGMIIFKSFERGKIPTGMYQMGIFSTLVPYVTGSKRKRIISKQK